MACVEQVISTSIKEYFPALLRLAFTLFMEKKHGHCARIRGNDLEWSAWLARHKGKQPLAEYFCPSCHARRLAICRRWTRPGRGSGRPIPCRGRRAGRRRGRGVP